VNCFLNCSDRDARLKGCFEMAVKWVTLGVAVFVAIIVAAGTGAYWAVRDNRSTVQNVDRVGPNAALDTHGDRVEDGTSADAIEPVLGTAAAVDATEEVIRPSESVADTRPSAEADGPSSSTQIAAKMPSAAASGRVESPAIISRGENTASTRPVDTDNSTPPSVVRPSPTSAPAPDKPTPSATSRNREQPVNTSLPRVEDDRTATATIPDRVALSRMDPLSVGVSLTPEARPQRIEELVIRADSVIGLQLDTSVSTDDAEVEDIVEARVTRDVMVGDQVAISAGSQVFGSVVLAERAGQFKGASRLGVRFHTVVLDNIAELPVSTETVYREGEGRGSKSAAKIGGAAIGGAILGAIFGGGQGAAIGSAAGAAGGTAIAMSGDGEPATFRAGSRLTVRLFRPATVIIEY